MKQFAAFTVLLGIASATPAVAKTVSISMMTANSIDKELPTRVFNEGRWQPKAGSEFVKLHMYFDDEIELGKVTATSCEDPFHQPVVLFVNFDGHVSKLPAGQDVLSKSFSPAVKARSVTLNFGQNVGFCIRDIALYDGSGKTYDVRVPKVVEGTMTASDTLDPAASYHVMNMFDSRFEYAWSTHKKTQGVVLEAKFNEAQTIDRLRVWNGYQRSDRHCWSNARPKQIKVEGDGGFSATVELEDTMGSQVVKFPKAVKTRSLKMTVNSAYKGKKWQDMVVSELRFGSGGDWLTFSPVQQIAGAASVNHGSFKKARLDTVLDRGLIGENAGATEDVWGNWKMRLRSDGSFYLEGDTEEETGDMETKLQTFTALGNYEIKKASRSNLKLRIFGLVRIYKEVYSEMGMDCNGCARDCNKRGRSGDGERSRIFDETLTLKRDGPGYLISNVTHRVLNFEELEMKHELNPDAELKVLVDKNFKGAKGTPKEAIKGLVGTGASKTAAASAANSMGFRAYKKKDWDGAIDWFDTALKYDDQHVLAAYNAACTWGIKGDADKAVAYLKKLTSNPSPAAKKRLVKARKDRDFTNVRSNETFKKFMSSL